MEECKEDASLHFGRSGQESAANMEDSDVFQLDDAFGYGVRLTTALQVYVEMGHQAKEMLHPIVSEISATASILHQLDAALCTTDVSEDLPVFNTDGIIEVLKVARQCKQVFKIVAGLVQKAGELKGHPTEEAKSQPLNLNLELEPGSLKPLTILASMWEKSDWLTPRLSRCYEQLRWLKAGLLLYLQLANLAKLHLDRGPRSIGAFDYELSYRAAAEKLRIRQRNIARKVVKRQEKEAKDAKEDDSDSDADVDDVKSIVEVVEVDDRPPKVPKVEPAVRSAPVAEANSGVDLPLPLPLPLAPAPAFTPASEQSSKTCKTPSVSIQASQASLLFLPKPPNLGPPPSIPGTTTSVPQGPAPPYSAGENVLNVPGLAPPQPLQDFKPSEPLDSDADFVFLENPRNEKTTGGQEASKLGSTAGEKSASPLASFVGLIPNWLQGIFGSSETMIDTTSADLEAYIAEANTASSPIKVPLGHERLKFGLNRIQKNKTDTVWFRYMDMNSVQRGIVDQVVNFAKGQSHHVRTCIAMEEFKREGQVKSYLIFFSLAEPSRPIKFKDAIGRKYSFPYELCRTWNGMSKLIREAFLHVDVVGPAVMQGCYDLIDSKGDIAMPSLWSANIRPGDRITMHMWPVSELPRAPRPGPKPFPPPPGFRYGLGGQLIPLPPPPVGGSNLIPIPPPPKPVDIIQVEPPSRSKKVSKHGSSILGWMTGSKKKEISAEQEAELTVVDFKAALETVKDRETVAKMLRCFTNATDVGTELLARLVEESDSGWDSGSDGYTTDTTMSDD